MKESFACYFKDPFSSSSLHQILQIAHESLSCCNQPAFVKSKGICSFSSEPKVGMCNMRLPTSVLLQMQSDSRLALKETRRVRLKGNSIMTAVGIWNLETSATKGKDVRKGISLTTLLWGTMKWIGHILWHKLHRLYIFNFTPQMYSENNTLP